MYLAQLARGATTVKPSIFRFVRNTDELIDFCFPDSELQTPFEHAQEWAAAQSSHLIAKPLH